MQTCTIALSNQELTMKTPLKNKSNENQQGSSKGNLSINPKIETLKSRGISNCVGQMSYQTDNKQATANKENENFMVQEKKSTKMPGKYSPKKD